MSRNAAPALALPAALLLLACLASPAAAVPITNNTSFNNGTLHLTLLDGGNTVCFRPAPETQILAFFLTNYIARIATFKKTSGYEGFRDYVKTLVSLFVPFLGISEAADTIARGSRFLGKDELGRALHAKALCVIVRGVGWRPQEGEIVRGCRLEAVNAKRRRRKRRSSHSHSRSRSRDTYSKEHGHRRRDSHDSYTTLNRVHTGSDADSDASEYGYQEEIVMDTTLLVDEVKQVETLVDPSKWKIQGYYSLPKSYRVATLTTAAVVQPLATSNAKSEQITLSNSYGTSKSFAAVVQIISSVYSLYSAYGSQVTTFGYAAFAFSVLPYTIMSALNAVANLIEADYDSLFLVRSDVMREAERREGGEFIGEVAELKPWSRDTEKGVPDAVDLRFHRDPATARWFAHEIDAHGNRASNRLWRITIPTLEKYSALADRRTKLYIPPVGRLYEADLQHDKRSRKFHGRVVSAIISLSLVLPYVIIGSISHFRRAQSSLQQRVLMMGWLVVGQIIGVMDLAAYKGDRHPWWTVLERVVVVVIVVLGFGFAVGGFVVTARMFREFGYCLRI